MITVYVLSGVASGKHYIGITNNLQRRLAEHQSGRTKGGQVLGEFILLLTEIYPDYATARLTRLSQLDQGSYCFAIRKPRFCNVFAVLQSKFPFLCAKLSVDIGTVMARIA